MAAPKRKRLEKTTGATFPAANNPSIVCCRCGTAYSRRTGNFPVSHSPMYRGIGYLPICSQCIDDMYEAYLQELHDDKEALHRMCMKLDLYWNEAIYQMVERMAGVRSRVRTYIGKTNIIRYIDKTYDDTIKENGKNAPGQTRRPFAEAGAATRDGEFTDGEDLDEVLEVDQAVIDFWGSGFPPDTYLELERRYNSWTSGRDMLDPAERAIYKQICILESTINRDSAQGKPIDKHVNALNTLLGSANLKPTQKKAEEADTDLDNMPFGVGIRKWETTRPVPAPDPELQDVDGIVKYIETWFKGHLAKMLGIKNAYSRLYEDEMARLSVTRPEYEDEDDEGLFENIFASKDEDDE